RESARDGNSAQRGFASGESYDQWNKRKPAPSAASCIERDRPRRARSAHERMACREPRVGLRIRCGQPEDRQSNCRRGRRKEPSIKKHHADEEDGEPQKRVRVISRRSIAKEGHVCGHELACQSAREVNLEVRSGPPREATDANGSGVARWVSGLKAKQVP